MGHHIAARAYGYVDPNFPSPGGKNDTYSIIYGYTPSIEVAAFAATWFFLHFVCHTVRTIRVRSWWWIPFSVGLIFEVIGYIARSLSAKKNPYNLIYFILNYFFIVVAPVFLAAGIYTVLSALIPRVGRKYSLLPPKVILGFFITSDVISTVVQIAGAVLIGVKSSRRQDPTTANNILLGGLAYQVFVMTVFVILAAIFQLRARRALKEQGLGIFCLAFSVSTLMLYLRTVFRLAETAQGLMGELQSNEVYFACLEFAPVALLVLLLAIWHPGHCVGVELRHSEKA
ncbi:RTA-like protein [Penicillium paradoxum]|uniref:RTA-like protein n=1 Tax=Penicillium paradoxum TaxID=176176 RepID=UPI0025490826|nr:RTA-like protein [Penicillium paradoxum]KAJ5782796.1 RTA-like protein [Penicillium paradoxum]